MTSQKFDDTVAESMESIAGALQRLVVKPDGTVKLVFKDHFIAGHWGDDGSIVCRYSLWEIKLPVQFGTELTLYLYCAAQSEIYEVAEGAPSIETIILASDSRASAIREAMGLIEDSNLHIREEFSALVRFGRNNEYTIR